MPNQTIFGFLTALLILTGCGHSSETERKPATAEDLQIARAAIPLSEVSLMLRGGYKQDAIIGEVTRRHVPSAPDAHTEDSLIQSGATAKLIAALKDKKNILTENQKEAYDSIASKKSESTQEAARQRKNQERADLIAENDERQRKQYLAQQTLQNAQAADYRAASYDQAERAYRARRESLEAQIISQENYILRARKYRHTEVELRNANAALDHYKEELRNLTPPIR
jgi:multidrug efflux pump subunit AcrA (membrane-fusion protein)